MIIVHQYVFQSPAKGVDLLKPDAAMTCPQVTAFELGWERSRNDWALISKQGRFLLLNRNVTNLEGSLPQSEATDRGSLGAGHGGGQPHTN
jgi:hypothetical protein